MSNSEPKSSKADGLSSFTSSMNMPESRSWVVMLSEPLGGKVLCEIRGVSYEELKR